MFCLRHLTRQVFHTGGAFALVRTLFFGGPRILTYHRFPQAAAALLAQQCAYLRRTHEIMPLSQMLAGLRGELPLSPRALAITIDDGYRDIYEVAYPVFRQHGIPAAAFLTTGFLDRQLWLWVDQVRYAVQHSPRAFVEIADQQWPLASASDRTHAIEEIKRTAKQWPDAQRRTWLAQLPAALQVDIPVEPPDEYAPLTWEQVRELRTHGFEFGAHTQTHPILSRLPSPADLHREIAGSKHRVEDELQQPADVFCYPNGRFTDIGGDTTAAVRAAGFRAAVTTEIGPNVPGADPFLLRRIGVDATDAPLYFRERAAGFDRL